MIKWHSPFSWMRLFRLRLDITKVKVDVGWRGIEDSSFLEEWDGGLDVIIVIAFVDGIKWTDSKSPTRINGQSKQIAFIIFHSWHVVLEISALFDVSGDVCDDDTLKSPCVVEYIKCLANLSCITNNCYISDDEVLLLSWNSKLYFELFVQNKLVVDVTGHGWLKTNTKPYVSTFLRFPWTRLCWKKTWIFFVSLSTV